MKDTLLILSGGMDSTTLLYDYKDRISLAVTFNYGSNHNVREAECARYNCESLGIEWIEINLDFMGKYYKSSLLDGADAIPEGSYDTTNIKSTVVPFRNGVMLSVAAGLAESRGLSNVMMANHSGDHVIYPDCRPEFVEAMNKAINVGTDSKVSLSAPYTNLSKSDIAKRGKAIGIDYFHTYSCYKGMEKHCGKCATCIERKQALADAGIDDPTEYLL